MVRRRLGIIGGMGPLASTEFLSTIYKLNAVEPEQRTPACILFSDPSCPDRTTCIQDGTTSQLTAWLVASLEEMTRLGAERIVIACITIHHVLPDIPEALRRKVISLIDLVIDELLAAPRPVLLLATSGTRTARIFESHPRWSEISPWVVKPGEEDQKALHDWIYRLKAGLPEEGCLAWLRSLRERYGVEGLLFGCTEFHLLHRNALKGSGKSLDIVDPLWIAARDLERLLME
jgi:aspartate racemase